VRLMQSCGVCVCVCVCLSVCLFVTFVDCVKKNKCIFKIFSLSGGQWTYQTAWQYSSGNPPPPLTGASNAGGIGSNRYSEPISGFTTCCEAFSGKCSTLSWDGPCRVYNTSRWWAAEFVDGRKQRRSLWQEASTLRQRQCYTVVNLKPK